MSKIKEKERSINTSREKQVTNKGKPVNMSAEVSAKILQASRECCDIFKVLKGKTYN